MIPNDIAIEFIKYLILPLFSYLLIYLFLYLLANTSTIGWWFKNEEDKRENKRFSIKLKNINLKSIGITYDYSKLNIVKLEGVEEKNSKIICFRILNDNLEDKQQKLNESIWLRIKVSELPIFFKLRITFFILYYKLLLDCFKPSEICIKMPKKLNKIIRDKIREIENIRRFNRL